VVKMAMDLNKIRMAVEKANVKTEQFDEEAVQEVAQDDNTNATPQTNASDIDLLSVNLSVTHVLVKDIMIKLALLEDKLGIVLDVENKMYMDKPIEEMEEPNEEAVPKVENEVEGE